MANAITIEELRVKLPERYCSAISFARTAWLHDLDPRDLARLCVLAERAGAAGVRETNTPNASAAKARDRFEAEASRLGLVVEWPGLYPEVSWKHPPPARDQPGGLRRDADRELRLPYLGAKP